MKFSTIICFIWIGVIVAKMEYDSSVILQGTLLISYLVKSNLFLRLKSNFISSRTGFCSGLIHAAELIYNSEDQDFSSLVY